MMITPDMTGTIQAIHSEAAALSDFLKVMDAEEWTRDSACPGWNVGDVVAHLAQGAHGWVDFIGRALAGDTNPPPGQQWLGPGDRGSETTAQRAIEQRQAHGPRELEDVVVYQDRFEVEAPNCGPADVRYSGPAHDYLLLIYGRLSFRGGNHIGRLKIDGSPERAALFNTWFRGV